MSYPGFTMTWANRSRSGVQVFLLCALAVPGFAAGPPQAKVAIEPREQHRPPTPSHRSNLRLDVALTLVPITVTDAHDRPVEDLSADSFRVFEDGVEQKIAKLAHEDGPVSVGFLFDASSSMRGRMEKSIEAVQYFLKTLTPGDEFFLVRFSDEPRQLTNFTPDPDEIASTLSSIRPEGWTALNDAICLGMQRMKSAKNPRRALFILTDGGDNNSRYSEAEVRALARESDVRVYAIGLLTKPRFLEKLALDTGGRVYLAPKMSDLPAAVERLSREFRNTYILCYSPRNDQHDGKYRKVRIEMMDRLSQLPLRVFWKRGYYAPTE